MPLSLTSKQSDLVVLDRVTLVTNEQIEGDVEHLRRLQDLAARTKCLACAADMVPERCGGIHLAAHKRSVWISRIERTLHDIGPRQSVSLCRNMTNENAILKCSSCKLLLQDDSRKKILSMRAAIAALKCKIQTCCAK